MHKKYRILFVFISVTCLFTLSSISAETIIPVLYHHMYAGQSGFVPKSGFHMSSWTLYWTMCNMDRYINCPRSSDFVRNEIFSYHLVARNTFYFNDVKSINRLVMLVAFYLYSISWKIQGHGGNVRKVYFLGNFVAKYSINWLMFIVIIKQS